MSITLFIIVITSAISFYAFKNTRLTSKWIFSPYLIYKEKEFQRFLSSGFIHADIYHLLFNMLSLYSFGENMEAVYNYYFPEHAKLYFIILYIGGIVISNLPFFIKNKNNPNYFSLGASGGISAVVFSFILFSPNSTMCIFGFICLPSLVFGLLYIMYVIYLNTNKIVSTTNHIAHLTGAAFGIIFNIILEPKIVPFFLHQLKNIKLF